MIWDALILIWRRCHETNQELPGTEVINGHINSRYMSGYVPVCPISSQLMWSYRIYNWLYDVSEAEYKKNIKIYNWWGHDMVFFIMMTSSNGNIFRVPSRVTNRLQVNSLHKGQWRGALMFSLICAWINGWVNNREAGDLRRHRAHYDIAVMGWLNLCEG